MFCCLKLQWNGPGTQCIFSWINTSRHKEFCNFSVIRLVLYSLHLYLLTWAAKNITFSTECWYDKAALPFIQWVSAAYTPILDVISSSPQLLTAALHWLAESSILLFSKFMWFDLYGRRGSLNKNFLCDPEEVVFKFWYMNHLLHFIDQWTEDDSCYLWHRNTH